MGNLQTYPGFILWQTAAFWRREIESVLQPLDLTCTQLILLSTLYECTYDGSDVTQAYLARHANLDITMTSQMLRTLEQKGFVKRHQQDGNDRSKFPKITKQGLQLLHQALSTVEEVDNAFFSCLRSDAKRCSDSLLKLQKEYTQ